MLDKYKKILEKNGDLIPFPSKSIHELEAKYQGHAAFKNWLDRCDGAKQFQYRKGLWHFLYIHDLTLDELLEIHANWLKDQQKEHGIMNLRIAWHKILYRTENMQKPGHAIVFKTIHSLDAGFRGFFTHATGVSLPKYFKNIKEAKIITTPTRELTIEEIGKLADRANDTQKWLFLFLLQSGLSRGDLKELEYNQQFKEQEDRGEEIIIFPYYRQKRKDMGTRWTWVGMDALEAWKAYKQSKNIQLGEPLFKGQLGEPLTERQIGEQISKLGDKAGIRLHCKMLRKYISSALRDYQVDGDIIALVTGHKMGDVSEAYTGLNRLKEQYRKIAREINPYRERVEKVKTNEQRIDAIEKEQMLMKAELQFMRQQIAILGSANHNSASAFQEAIKKAEEE